uniref:Uncharacterized protein n=1 Tax=Globodera rostochiensis TaxID=31243 RepID=A0A914H7D9_GLORO
MENIKKQNSPEKIVEVSIWIHNAFWGCVRGIEKVLANTHNGRAGPEKCTICSGYYHLAAQAHHTNVVVRSVQRSSHMSSMGSDTANNMFAYTIVVKQCPLMLNLSA